MPNYRRLPARLLWGATYQNALDLGYPLDGAIAGSTPREGSEWAQGNSGAEDAWITGHDQWLQGDARWIPRDDTLIPEGRRHSGWNGTTGWRAFLEWARAKNVVLFYPDARNRVLYPGMNTDSDGDGAADGFSNNLAVPGVTGQASIDAGDPSQKITITASTSQSNVFPGVLQRMRGFMPSEVATISIEYRTANLLNGMQPYVYVHWEDAASSLLLTADLLLNPSDVWTRISWQRTAPAGTVQLGVNPGFRIPAGSGGTGTVWYRNLTVEVGPTATGLYIPNPFYSCYLAEPMTDDPEAEKDFSRKLKLRLRTVDGSALDGY